jgi:hypothetical protein
VKTAFGSLVVPQGVAVANREEQPGMAVKPTGTAMDSCTDDPRPSSSS